MFKDKAHRATALANPLTADVDFPPNGDKRFAMSWTKFEAYEQCPRKYYETYIAKSIPFEEGAPALEWGKAVHYAAEIFVRDAKPVNVDGLVALAKKLHQKDLDAGKGRRAWTPSCMGKDAFNEDALRSWAASFTNLLATIKQRGAALAAESAIPPTVEMKWAVDWNGRQVAWTSANVFIRGQADLTMASPDKLVTLDYKTGSGKFPKPEQLEVMALLAKGQRYYTNYKFFEGMLLFVETERFVKYETDLSTQSLHGDVLSKYQEKAIEIHEAFTTKQWAARSGPLCGFCPVTTCPYNTTGAI